MSLSGRTISALKRAGITNPTTKTIGDLLRTPGLGTKALTEIADRTYANQYAYRDEPWPELVDEPKKPIQRCSHRVPVDQPCSKCLSDHVARATGV